MLRHPKAEHRFDLAAFQFFAQLLYRGNLQFLVNAQNPLGIEAGIIGETRDFRRRLAPQRVQFPELSGQDDFPDRARNRLADPRKLRQVSVFPDQFIETFGERTDSCRCAVIGLDLVGIFFLRREELRQPRQAVCNLRIAERGGLRGGLCVLRECPWPLCLRLSSRGFRREARRREATMTRPRTRLSSLCICSIACSCSRRVRAAEQSDGTYKLKFRILASCAVQTMQLFVASPVRIRDVAPR